MTALPTFALVGDDHLAPGAAGAAPTWASSDKDFVTTSLVHCSENYYTLFGSLSGLTFI